MGYIRGYIGVIKGIYRVIGDIYRAPSPQPSLNLWAQSLIMYWGFIGIMEDKMDTTKLS